MVDMATIYILYNISKFIIDIILCWIEQNIGQICIDIPLVEQNYVVIFGSGNPGTLTFLFTLGRDWISAVFIPPQL